MRIGPEYYSNRWLDWPIRDGRLESVEGSTASRWAVVTWTIASARIVIIGPEKTERLIVAVDGAGKIVVRDDSQLEGPREPRADHAPVPTEPNPAYDRGTSGTGR